MKFPHPVYSRHVLQPAYVDAQTCFFEPMLAAHEAHAIMLAECGIITPANAAAIVNAVASIRADGVAAYAYQPGIEDLFFRIEGRIIELAGADDGGNLQLARSRNDLGHTLARMALRTRVLDIQEALLELRTAVMTQAQRHLDTLMPGYTHTQPAQPVTFAHYLAGVLTFLAHDQAKFAAAYATVNQSPLGAAALTGTGFPIDRRRVAALLGFDDVVLSTQHAIGGGEYLTDVAFAVQALAIDLSRMTHDLLVRATQEANALRIDDSFIQISSIMPQKRNPVVLEHLRARLSRALGYAQTVVMQCHSIPYGDTQDIEDEILPPTFNALAAVAECLELYTAVFETLTLNKEHLRRQASEGFTTATELADTLVREAGLPFRLAHRVVAHMVQRAVQDGISSSQLTLDRLQAAARQVLGRELLFTEAQFRQALDPVHFVAVRTGEGGVAPGATAVVLTALQNGLDADAQQVATHQKLSTDAEKLRHMAAERILAR
ncbi:MAG TPA: argininosuccinate lyase [Chloroflexi bacterium]|nr:argininosuccinate lyase [Chloroflexota bacterium]